MTYVVILAGATWLLSFDQYGSAISFCHLKYNTTKNNQMPKVKDLPNIDYIIGKKVRTKKGVIGYVVSMTDSVVHLHNQPLNGKPKPIEHDDNMERRLYPQVLADSKILLDWDIIDDPDIKTNCCDLTSHKYILNE